MPDEGRPEIEIQENNPQAQLREFGINFQKSKDNKVTGVTFNFSTQDATKGTIIPLDEFRFELPEQITEEEIADRVQTDPLITVNGVLNYMVYGAGSKIWQSKENAAGQKVMELQRDEFDRYHQLAGFMVKKAQGAGFKKTYASNLLAEIQLDKDSGTVARLYKDPVYADKQILMITRSDGSIQRLLRVHKDELLPKKGTPPPVEADKPEVIDILPSSFARSLEKTTPTPNIDLRIPTTKPLR